jgi:endonuclease-3
LDPIEELILTVLSQNTSDVNRDRAFEAMRRAFPSWEALALADERELAAAIRPGGLSNVKAPRILSILAEIKERESGALDLSWMRSARSDRVRRYLMSLPGVGPKTAACVLAFSLGRPALPVDTHVYRVAHRLGFFGERTDAVRAHATMERSVPARLRVGMHVGMIRLGRKVCRPGQPACELCPLQDLCPTAPSILRARRGR